MNSVQGVAYQIKANNEENFDAFLNQAGMLLGIANPTKAVLENGSRIDNLSLLRDQDVVFLLKENEQFSGTPFISHFIGTYTFYFSLDSNCFDPIDANGT